VTSLEFLFRHALWKCFYRHAAKLAARRYIKEHFRTSTKKHPRSAYSLKHTFEDATNRYINEADFTESLRHCGFKVVDGRVFTTEAKQ
jgi:capsular polysaccharide biosynthesis protein